MPKEPMVEMATICVSIPCAAIKRYKKSGNWDEILGTVWDQMNDNQWQDQIMDHVRELLKHY